MTSRLPNLAVVVFVTDVEEDFPDSSSGVVVPVLWWDYQPEEAWEICHSEEDNICGPVLTMPTLPLELEREIFEIAFRSSYKYSTYDGSLRTKLGQVAPRVQHWISLILYESIDLIVANNLAHFSHLLDTADPPDFFTIAVKHLRIGPSCLGYISEGQSLSRFKWLRRFEPKHNLVRILSTYTAVEQLRYYLDPDPAFSGGRTRHDISQVTPLIRQLPLNRLWIQYTLFIDVAEIRIPDSSLYPNLTHLSITFDKYEELADSEQRITLIRMVSQFPRLTHFAFDSHKEQPSAALLKQFCSALPEIQCIAVSWSHSQLKQREDSDYSLDERTVQVCLGHNHDKHSEDQKHVWECAAEILAERKRSEPAAVDAVSPLQEGLPVEAR
ncbi:hypothetical protein FB45DRAFT_1045916 [Roridomyces roridus]|uniref:Uncharacterized protein n=1 Tax=Roridomyces roridus TaxID=1738132 RepID=A0AAD7F5Q3_9AGAR|nr:hypothetical protein FB45DRAFT_1045916 [Roridomyces roridus]